MPSQTSNPPSDARPTLCWVAWKMALAALRRPWCIPHLIAAVAGVRRRRALRRAAGANERPETVVAVIEHMGDIIAAEPISRYAAEQYPDNSVAWVARTPYRAAVSSFPAVDRIVTVGCMTEWLLLWATARRQVRVWDAHISNRACPVCNIGFKKPGLAGHITYDTYYDLGNLLKVNCLIAGIPVLDEAPRLVPDPVSVAVVDRLELPERFVVLHCKSNEDRRDWVDGKWLELVERLTAEVKLPVCEIGGCAVAVAGETALTRSLCGKLALMETAEVIARATLFIGIDSGPAHLANAAGTPGVVLLGRYHLFDRYTPYSGGYGDGSRAELVRSTGPARDISVEEVMAAVSRQLQVPSSAPDKGAAA